ncbi:carbohydrate ABC transporter permease, partial [Macellibacteroides fermentans]|uniref:carbohydrate ABC transporter permease n=1 Tax=Macellibacteroides fermentans TaxID=879969 RepID=UPI00406D3466
SLQKYENSVGWSMVIPATIFIVLFSYLPILQGFLLSFKTGKGVNLVWSGFANYVRLFKDMLFWRTLGNTLLYAGIHIPIMLFLSLLIAVLLTKDSIPLKGIFRTCIFLPCVTSLVSYALLFRSIFSVDGVVNNILQALNLISQPISFLLHPVWAKVVIVLALIWRNTGYYMVFFLAALQNIDPQIMEAARIDGCKPYQALAKITIPMLRPVIFLTSIMALNSTLQTFDEVVNLTNGGPGDATRTISQYIYDLSFTFVPSYGYSAAVSYVVLIIVLSFTLLNKRYKERNDG